MTFYRVIHGRRLAKLKEDTVARSQTRQIPASKKNTKTTERGRGRLAARAHTFLLLGVVIPLSTSTCGAQGSAHRPGSPATPESRLPRYGIAAVSLVFTLPPLALRIRLPALSHFLETSLIATLRGMRGRDRGREGGKARRREATSRDQLSRIRNVARKDHFWETPPDDPFPEPSNKRPEGIASPQLTVPRRRHRRRRRRDRSEIGTEVSQPPRRRGREGSTLKHLSSTRSTPAPSIESRSRTRSIPRAVIRARESCRESP